MSRNLRPYQSVPFATNPASDSYSILGFQPIVHFSPNSTTSINQTLPGHWFHPGRVVHVTFMHQGAVWFYTRGVGVGSNPFANEIIGYGLFGKMHSDVVDRVQWQLLGNPESLYRW